MSRQNFRRSDSEKLNNIWRLIESKFKHSQASGSLDDQKAMTELFQQGLQIISE